MNTKQLCKADGLFMIGKQAGLFMVGLLAKFPLHEVMNEVFLKRDFSCRQLPSSFRGVWMCHKRCIGGSIPSNLEII